MGGKSSQETQSSSKTEPWKPAVPVLSGILSGVQSQLPNYQPTAAETGAIGQIQANAQGLTNWAPQAENLTNKYLTGDPTGLLSPALQAYNTSLSPFATGDVDPTKTPGIQNLISTIRDDVTRATNERFAGAGRDLSGLNQEYLGRGVAAGVAPVLLNQYNENVRNRMNAAGGLMNAAGTAAGAMTQNQGNALNLAQSIPQLQNMGPMGILAAQALQRGLPLENLGMLANLTVPIAGLGGQQQGTSNTQNTMSPVQTALGWTGAFRNLFAPYGGR